MNFEVASEVKSVKDEGRGGSTVSDRLLKCVRVYIYEFKENMKMR